MFEVLLLQIFNGALQRKELLSTCRRKQVHTDCEPAFCFWPSNNNWVKVTSSEVPKMSMIADLTKQWSVLFLAFGMAMALGFSVIVGWLPL